jgi:hypothetical protein
MLSAAYFKTLMRRLLPPLLISLLLAGFYGLTLAPGLSWANNGADGGDFITALATGGVPHPGGYPLYLWLARPFQFLPWGTLAFRTNLFSAVCTGLAALLLYALLRRRVRASIAMLSALAFGLAPLVWGQAVITEVYGLNCLLTLGFLFALEDERIPDWGRGLALGLALDNHLTALLLLPLLLLDFSSKALLVSPRALAQRLAGLLAGLLIYLSLPLRALTRPPVNWGNPATLDGFLWLVSGKLYTGYLFNFAPDEVFLRLQAAAQLLLEQFTLPGLLLGLVGAFSRPWRGLASASLWVFCVSVLFTSLYGSYDSTLYLLPAWIVFSIWLALGVENLAQQLPRRIPQAALPAILLAALLARAPFLLPKVDAAHDTRAEAFGARFVQTVPAGALVFASQDPEIFALEYFHHALGQRPDVVIINEGLLPFDWYLNTLRDTYPALNLPTVRPPAAFDFSAANPARPICHPENEIFICQ